MSLNGKEYTAEQISAFIIRRIRNETDKVLGYPIRKVVMTVPSYFNYNQDRAVREAANLAGLELVRLLPESVAAGAAWCVDRPDWEEKVLVISLGGGGHDVAVMNTGGGVMQVLSTIGQPESGGDSLDWAIVELFLEDIKNTTRTNLRRSSLHGPVEARRGEGQDGTLEFGFDECHTPLFQRFRNT